MSVLPFDDRDGVIWFDGKLVPWRDAKVHVLTHGLHYASCVFEGERAYNGKVFKSTEHSERLHRSAEILGFKIPFSAEEIDAAKKACDRGQQADATAMSAPVAWRGSEMMGVSAQKNAIHLAIATWEWPSYFSPELQVTRHPHDLLEMAPAGAGYRADHFEGRRSLHDLHPVQARGGERGLCRRPDARLSRPDRRGHRRQRVPGAGRQGAYAEAGLLPRRHHPPHGHRPRAQARPSTWWSGRSCRRNWARPTRSSSPAPRRK